MSHSFGQARVSSERDKWLWWLAELPHEYSRIVCTVTLKVCCFTSFVCCTFRVCRFLFFSRSSLSTYLSLKSFGWL